ncbi:MAG: DUF2490 domain-containing protein [Kaistella sp.]|nr:DUF2490 domain-containing protein [Kaistella sp.]
MKNDWSLNTKIESRQRFQSGEVNGEIEENYRYVLTDFSLIAAKKVGLNSQIGAGYLMRLREGELFHRLIQQYSVVQKFSGFRLAHRFASDQTFSRTEKPEVRLRYRISSEIPLNGESADPGELYLKLNNEYLYGIQASESDFEIRLVPLLGYGISENLKWETGLDYRAGGVFKNSRQHSYWVTVNIYIEI